MDEKSEFSELCKLTCKCNVMPIPMAASLFAKRVFLKIHEKWKREKNQDSLKNHEEAHPVWHGDIMTL